MARVCLMCDADISNRDIRAKYCFDCIRLRDQESIRKWHSNPANRKKKLEQHRKYARSSRGKQVQREWVKNNRERVREIARNNSKSRRKRLRDKWGYVGTRSLRVAMEYQKVGIDILQSLDYQVLDLKGRRLFDCMARSPDGRMFGVEVSADYKKNIKKDQTEFLEFTGIGLIVLFIKPDLSHYRVIEITEDYKTSVNAFNQVYPGGLIRIRWDKQVSDIDTINKIKDMYRLQ